MIEQIEDAIVDRLAARLPALKVEAFPDDPKSWRMYHRVGNILVAYGRSRPIGGTPVDVIVQERELEWDIHLKLRNLRRHDGAYSYLDAVRIALMGWQYPGAKKMVPGPDRFIGQDDGIWTYMASFSHRITVVEAAEDEVPVLVTRITTEDNHGNVEVTE